MIGMYATQDGVFEIHPTNVAVPPSLLGNWGIAIAVVKY